MQRISPINIFGRTTPTGDIVDIEFAPGTSMLHISEPKFGSVGLCNVQVDIAGKIPEGSHLYFAIVTNLLGTLFGRGIIIDRVDNSGWLTVKPVTVA